MQPPFRPPPQGAPYAPWPHSAPPPPPRPSRGPAIGDALPVFALVKWGLLLVFGLPCLALVVYAIVQFETEKKGDILVFDNRTSESCDVSVDGKRLVSLAADGAWDSARVEALPKSSKAIRVVCSGGTVVDHTLSLPPRKAGSKRGFRGIFVIEAPGPKGEYVVAKLPYYTSTPEVLEKPKVVYLDTQRPIVELPSELESFEMSINQGFAPSDSSYNRAPVQWQSHVCSFRREGNVGKVGCRGFPDVKL